MNASTSRHQGHPYRRAMHRLVAALLVSITLLSLVVSTGEARSYTTGGSQMGFVHACRANGGETKRLATYVVQCTLPNGYVIVCNFGTGRCVDFPPAQISAATPANNPEADATFDWIDDLADIPPATTQPPSR